MKKKEEEVVTTEGIAPGITCTWRKKKEKKSKPLYPNSLGIYTGGWKNAKFRTWASHDMSPSEVKHFTKEEIEAENLRRKSEVKWKGGDKNDG